MKKTLLLSLSLALSFIVVSSVGCAEAVGCDFREGGPGDPEPRCQERRGFQANGFDAFCSGLGATPVPGGCPVEGIVGGCEQGDITDWYYEPETPETVAVLCADDELTPVDPPAG